MNVKTALFLLSFVAVFAQEPEADRLTIPFRDPSRPGVVKANLISGSVAVHPHSGNDVIIEASRKGSRRKPSKEAPEGMRRISAASTGLRAEEDNNVINVSLSPSNSSQLVIQAPSRTSWKLRTIQGSIVVDKVEGDVEAESVHGSINLNGLGGSATAHVLHGKLVAKVDAINPAKPLTFSSVHGDIDVTFPHDAKLTLKINTVHGDVFSDFDVNLPPRARDVQKDKEGEKIQYRVKTGSEMVAAINGGGPEVTFKTLHGNIYIRKAK